ncbi:SulP family inorganic anion transporter [Staphylococcus sp. SS251]|nr:SulP family inorganic anion transporter [Staphylococcus singaporensis]MBE5678167.1 SulP family inorganic anion transporter [Staphylococcus singaporensis]
MTDIKIRKYIESWQGHYSQNILVGVLLALALLPVAIAFSFIVHINPSIGLMTCGMMMFLMSIFGKRLAMVSGPSSGISIVAAPLVIKYGTEYLFAATVVMGILLIILGLAHINRLLKLIPDTVVIGFMNALGILLLVTQVKYIFGISIATYVTAILTVVVMIVSTKFIKVIPSPLVAIIVISLGAYLLKPKLLYVYDLAQIQIVLPTIYVPNEFWHWSSLKIVLVYGTTMAVISVIQTHLTNQMIDDLTNSKTNKNNEIISQGISNLLIGFLGGYGSSGLVGQSKYFYRMGATSRLATLSTGIFLLLCVELLSPVIEHIPMVVLAVVLVSVSLNTFDRRTWSHMKSSPIKNGTLMLFTMLLILLTNNLAIGVIVGAVVYYLWQFISKKGRVNDDNIE